MSWQGWYWRPIELAEVTPTEKKEAASMQRCLECGAFPDPNDTYCRRCGSRVQNTETQVGGRMHADRKNVVRFSICFMVGLSILLTVGCGSSRTPSETVTRFHVLMVQGKYETASKYLSSEAKLMFGLFVGLAEGMKQFASEEFGSQVIRRVEILSERISGNQAEVRYILHYTDGTKGSADSDVLVKEKGQWRIGLSW